MVKKSIDLSNVIEGMKLAEDVFDKQGHLLLAKKTELTFDMINRIKTVNSSEELLIYVEKSEIELLVEKDNGEQVQLNSLDVKIEVSENQKKLRKQIATMEETLIKTFDNLMVNANDKNAKKEIDKTVEDIKNNININVDLLNEIVGIKDVDDYLYTHSLNVAMIANLIGKWLKLPSEDLEILIMGGMLHDIGKLKVNQNILNKPGRLTVEEFEEIKKHPVYSHNLLKEAGYEDSKLLKAVTFHHEKQDGSGYPLGLKGEKIPVHARILAVADIFDAMTSNRVYKKRVSPFKVLEMFQNQTFGKLDASITMLFVKKFSEYYVGAHVELNNGEKGTIVNLNHYEVTKPLLRLDSGKFVDISKDRKLEIVDLVNKKMM